MPYRSTPGEGGGSVSFATQQQAEAGTATTVAMSPLRSSDHTDAPGTGVWASPKLTVDTRGRRVVFAAVDGDIEQLELLNARQGQLCRLIVHNTAATAILVRLATGTVTGATMLRADDVAVGAGDREQVELLLTGAA